MIRRFRSPVSLLGFILLLILLPVVQAQNGMQTLQQAISAGQATAVFHGTGGSSGDSVMAEVSRGPKAPAAERTVSVPPGSKLASSDAGAQGMMILGVAGRVTGPNSYEPTDNIVIPARGSATYALRAFCSEFHKDNPSTSTEFTLGSPDRTLACIARRSESGNLSIEATQAAVWMYTDGVTYGEMNQKFPISTGDWNQARGVASACGVTPPQ